MVMIAQVWQRVGELDSARRVPLIIADSTLVDPVGSIPRNATASICMID